MRSREEKRKLWGKAGEGLGNQEEDILHNHKERKQLVQKRWGGGEGIRVSRQELKTNSNNGYLLLHGALHRDAKGKILPLIRTVYFCSPPQNISSQVSILVLSFHVCAL